MHEWHYQYAGLQVASQVELPEWTSFATAPTRQQADVRITCTAPVTAAACAVSAVTADATQLALQWPAIGSYRICGGREIVIAPCRDAAAAEVRLFLLGSAWSAIGYQRGWFPLHASVIQVGESAVAFCAPSGGGKSSLAAWFLRQGYGLVSDDLCRLDITANAGPCVWPAAPRLKLWRDALAALQWQTAGMQRDHCRFDKFHLPAPTTNAIESTTPVLPLRAIYLLAWGDPCLQQCHGLRAVRALLAGGTYRPDYVTALGRTTTYWQQAIELVNQTPIFLLQRPRTWTCMAATAQLLQTHWHAELGLITACADTKGV